MKIQQMPKLTPRFTQKSLKGPQPDPTPAPAPDPKPQPTSHFGQSSRSLRRDSLLGSALASTIVLPKNGAMGVGAVVGGLGVLAAYGEIREGMRNMNTHEVLDGAIHMGASVALLASAAMPGTVVGGFVAAGGMSLLAAKTVYDRPKDVADVLLRQPIGLVRDAGKSIWLEFKKTEKY
ncbi:MAG: hypothetical protein U0931_30415 [Vulcanimicrobiota bacterium]